MQGREMVDSALASLMREHQLLSTLVDSLACYAKRLFEANEVAEQSLASRERSAAESEERGENADNTLVESGIIERRTIIERSDLALFTQVLSGFADELHHEKEEEILQPILSRHGLHWQDGLLADVRMEHERERYLIEVLGQAAECELAWTTEDRRSVAATALALVTFQREHMDKENLELFPEVARRLGDAALAELRSSLERFDRVPRHVAQSAELLAIADRLVSRYPPATRGSSAATQLDDPARQAVGAR